MFPDGPDGLHGTGACDVLFVGNQELYEIFLLDRAHATVAGYHIVQARKLLGKFPKLSKYITSGRFLLTVEDIFFNSSSCQRPFSSCEAAASAAVWCRVLDSVKAPELPLDVVEERMQALQQRLLRFAATGGDPSAATLIMVETSNLLDFLGLRHHPASSSLRSCVGELSKRPQGRMVALTDAVKVVAGLRQFIDALYGDANHTTTIQDQHLMEALGCACGPGWQGRCEEILQRREWSPENYLEEEDETVQRARAWLNSRGLCDTSPAALEQGEVSTSPLRDPQLPTASQRRSSRRPTATTPTPKRAPRPWAAEVRRQEAMSDRLKAKACAEKMPLPRPDAVRRAQQRAKKIQLKQAEEEALKLEQRLYHGQLVAAKTAELFRERDQRRVRSARSVSRERKDLTGRSLLDSHRERPRWCAPAPEPCPGQ